MTPSLVFLHGGGLAGRQWDGVRARLPDVQTFAPDLPGHGARVRERLTLEGAARTVLDLLDGAGVPAAHLISNSLGGTVALHLAQTRPNRVRSLLLTGTTGTLSPFEGKLMLLSARLPLPRGPLLAAALRQFRIPPGDRGWVREALAAWLGPGAQADLTHALLSLPAPRPLPLPALLLAGERETRFARLGALRLADRLGGVPALLVPGAGHVWNLEDPELFARTVRAWVTETALPGELRAPHPRFPG